MSALLGTLLLYQAYAAWVLPWLKRERFPFSSALRELRQLQRMHAAPTIYRRGLKIFHAAVNKTAGRVILAGNLNDFFSGNAAFATLEPEVSALYRVSQNVFFDNAEIAEPGTRLNELY
jgi:hypothetical protein